MDDKREGQTLFETLTDNQRGKIRQLTDDFLNTPMLFATWLRECMKAGGDLTKLEKITDYCSYATSRTIEKAVARSLATKPMAEALALQFGVEAKDKDRFVRKARGVYIPSVTPQEFDPTLYKLLQDLLKSIGQLFTHLPVFAGSNSDGNITVPSPTEELERKLRHLASSIYLRSEHGILTRLDIRHILLRQKTLLLLLKNLTAEQLRDSGKEIGIGASSDLLKGLKTKPRTINEFIANWNYWDQTGGWGEILLERDTTPAPGKPMSPKVRWRIRVRNNFLNSGDKVETRKLSNFWCGYIEGFLTSAALHFNRVEANDDATAATDLSVLPKHKVIRVEFLREGEEAAGDLFVIYFSDEEGATEPK